MFQVFAPKMVTNVLHILPHLLQFFTFFNFKANMCLILFFFFFREEYVSDPNRTLPNVNYISRNLQM